MNTSAPGMRSACSDIGMSVRGRFAPSPTGRMHLGNVFTALISWLSVRSQGGKWVLRIEDLDPQRSRPEYTSLIEDDLQWLGLYWDEGGHAGRGTAGPYMQSQRHKYYEEALKHIIEQGRAYVCRCTRAELRATQAPHATDGSVIYPGTCRPATAPPYPTFDIDCRANIRVAVEDRDVVYDDVIYGRRHANLANDCGDFLLRRADGAWAYQLAVTVDDGLMGITEVVRGCDLLTSVPRQDYLRRLLGLPGVTNIHLPLLCNPQGQRLSKRDRGVDMAYLRDHYTADEIIGRLAHAAGLTKSDKPCRPHELIPTFDIHRIVPHHIVL